MLRELNIKNFAIIDDLQVEFTPGFNVITGETGSGKSILIDALELILGGRANKDFIRSGKDQAFIQGLFSLPPDQKDDFYCKFNIWPEDELIITRELFRNKSGITRLNGQIISVSQLQKIVEHIIDVFAQREGTDLISAKKQRSLLDSFGDGKHQESLIRMERIYKEIKEIEDFLVHQEIDENSRAREIDLIQFQLEEIDHAQLTIDDEDHLTEEYKKLSNIHQIQEGISKALDVLDDYSGQGALGFLDLGISFLAQISQYDNGIEDSLNSLESLRYELMELIRDLKNKIDIDDYENHLYQLEQRLNLVNSLKRKYGNTIDKIEQFYKNSLTRLNFLEDYDKVILEKKEVLRSLRNQGKDLAQAISKNREKIGQFLEKAITKELQDLNIPNGKFYVVLSEKELSENGQDRVEFYIKTNIGQEAKPLVQIASGGEMSRIMLGFKSVIAKTDEIETLVFDEIDTGISGRTAQVVGKKIQDLSKDRQTIVISHLPQIVSLADSHFYIQKENKDDRVISTIHRLHDEQRVIELARLISGQDITDMSIETAREMIQAGSREEDLC